MSGEHLLEEGTAFRKLRLIVARRQPGHCLLFSTIKKLHTY